MSEKVRNQVEYKVYGKYALFSDPINRMGGEKCSYMVPTYQALKGITESIYWKPSIIWVIDEVRIMKPIRTESKNIRPISYNAKSDPYSYTLPNQNTLSVYTYLSDVEYQVRAHFIPNPHRTEPDLIADGQNENKHHNIAKKMINKGGRRDIFLGTRECQGYVEPCTYGEGESFYDRYGELDLGFMVHGFDYADETGKDMLSVRLWHATMKNGVITFIPPDQCDPLLKRDIHPMHAKHFGRDRENFSGLKERSIQDELQKGTDDVI